MKQHCGSEMTVTAVERGSVTTYQCAVCAMTVQAPSLQCRKLRPVEEYLRDVYATVKLGAA